MFGTLVYTEKGMIFETWETYDEAIFNAEVEKQNGHKVILFDYNKESKCYREYFSLPE